VCLPFRETVFKVALRRSGLGFLLAAYHPDTVFDWRWRTAGFSFSSPPDVGISQASAVDLSYLLMLMYSAP